MSNNSKPKQAFPGRTGMGYESGISKLEYITVQLVSGLITSELFNENAPTSSINFCIETAKQIIAACEEAEKKGQ